MDKEFVCNDEDGDWYYFAKDLMYRRLNGDEVRGHITGKNIPDPFLLDRARKRIHPAARPPTQATYKLWEHWNARQ